MYWARVKTILIVLFTCVNVFLLISMMISVNQSIVISDNTVRNTVEVLQKNDIFISSNIIPRKIQNLSFLMIDNIIQDPDVFAEKVMGAGYKKQMGQEQITYTLGSQKLTVDGWKFSYKNSVQPTGQRVDESTVEGYIKNYLELIGFDLRYIHTRSIEKQSNGSYDVILYQQYEGKEIFYNDIIAKVSSKGAVTIEGNAIIPRGFSDDKLPGRQVTSVLIEFIRREDRPKNKEMTITDITLGYIADTNMKDHKMVLIAPVWRIVAKQEGEQAKYIGEFDAIKMSNTP